ncbi:MAG TPA: SpoIIE family protein phosphatase [Vicinamibacteria bacterium]
MTLPVVQKCREELLALDREGREPALHARLSQLVSLLDFATRLVWTARGDEVPDAVLGFVMGELQASAGVVYVASGKRGFERRAARGLVHPAPEVVTPRAGATHAFVPGAQEAELEQAGIAMLCPVLRADRPVALVGLGPREGGRGYSDEDLEFLESLAAMAATPIEAGLTDEELRRVNRDLSVRVYQLQNLFDIGRALTATLEVEEIERLVVTTVMGYFLATRAALYHAEGDALELGHARGARPGALPLRLPGDLAALSRELPGPRPAADLPAGALRDAMMAADIAIVVPLLAPGRLAGLLAVGSRPGARPVAPEDLDFAAALVRQAQAALEAARLHRMRLEKERQDRDLVIARGIQLGLLPKSSPRLPGFEIAGESRSCLEVGGDYFDYVPLAGDRLGLVIADVSGKGTPASLMMASVHAWLRALAGSEPAVRVLERLNRFVYSSTETSRYVTLFYGELDPRSRRLVYVNAGHVPPFLVRSAGGEERLRSGGPVLGLLEEVTLEPGEIELGAGDLLAAVTDGVTEATSPADQEFGDERVRQVLAAQGGAGARATLDGLIAAVDSWAGPAGCGDDLTALILRAT